MTAVEFFAGATAAEYHARDLPADGKARIWIFEPARPALVLGSTQPESVVDVRAARSLGIEIARRRSGGGAVLLAPGETIWIDVLVPRVHGLWRLDIGAAPVWLGESVAATLVRSGLGRRGIHVHTGAMERSPWSTLVCFAGRGPGEVFDVHGSKVLGISQRRTRDWARFQCVVSWRWNPELLTALLSPPRPESSDIDAIGASIANDVSQDIERMRADLIHDVITVLETDGDSSVRLPAMDADE